MNKVLFVSRGGNTEKLANAIAEGAGITAERITPTTTIEGTDTLFLGASIYAGKVDKTLVTFINSIKPESLKKVVVFSTAASKKTAKSEIRALFDSKKITVIENEFFCKGSFLLANRNRPNNDDLKQAKAFGKSHSL